MRDRSAGAPAIRHTDGTTKYGPWRESDPLDGAGVPQHGVRVA
jgi:hypothetical protein